MIETSEALKQYTRDIAASLAAPSALDRRHALIEENLRLVVSIARRYATISSVPFLDLVQEGNLGLIRATQDFDPHKGTFSTHAIWWIKQSILHALTREHTLLTVPDYLIERLSRLRKLQRNHPEWTQEQLATEMHVSVATLKDTDTLSTTISIASLNKSGNNENEDSTLEETLQTQSEEDDPEAVVVQMTRLAALKQLLGYLTHDERRVIGFRYGFDSDDNKGMTQHDIARHMRISKERVRGLEQRALLKLRTYAKTSHLAEACGAF